MLHRCDRLCLMRVSARRFIVAQRLGRFWGVTHQCAYCAGQERNGYGSRRDPADCVPCKGQNLLEGLRRSLAYLKEHAAYADFALQRNE